MKPFEILQKTLAIAQFSAEVDLKSRLPRLFGILLELKDRRLQAAASHQRRLQLQRLRDRLIGLRLRHVAPLRLRRRLHRGSSKAPGPRVLLSACQAI